MTSLQIGLVPTEPVAASLEWVSHAEDRGFDGVWVADSPSIFREAFTTLAALALRTSRLRLATGVTNPVTRHPAVLASAFATLDELSNGRAVAGVGVGASTVRTLGLDAARLAEVEEVVRVLRALLAGERAVWRGVTLQMPWSGRRVPVVLASSGPRSLRLAGRIADGVLFQVGADPDLVRWAIGQVRAGAEEAGRSLDNVELLMRLGCVVSGGDTDPRDEVRGYAAAAAVTVAFSVPRQIVPPEIRDDLTVLEESYEWLGHARGEARHVEVLTDRLLDRVTVTGDPETVTERLTGLAALGVDGFVIPVLGGDPFRQVELLGRVAAEMGS